MPDILFGPLDINVNLGDPLAAVPQAGIGLINDFEVVLTLGGFGFTTHELPDTIHWGLDENINLHELIGGNRVLDMMGDKPKDFTWSGWFIGPNAADRAADLYALEQKKGLINLQFGPISSNVVISSLELSMQHNFYRIPYSITCIVVNNDGGGGAGAGGAGNLVTGAINQLTGGLLNQVPGLNQAANLLIQNGNNALQNAIAPLAAQAGLQEIQNGFEQQLQNINQIIPGGLINN